MKKTLKKAAHFSSNTLLWVGSLFFILGALTYFDKSIASVVFMLLLGLVLLPPAWKKINSARPKLLNTRFRVILSLVLLVLAIQVTPVESTTTRPVAKSSESFVQTNKTEALKSIDQTEEIVSIAHLDDRYVIKGTGVANQEYSLTFLDRKTLSARTDNNGNYSVDIPKWASVFGQIELSRDTNGWWFGGEQTYEKGYYVLTETRPHYSNDTLEPVLFGIGGLGVYEASGYYLPNTTLLLKSGDTTLSTAKVDDSGRYQFNNISLETNYKPIAIYEKMSTGWFSSEEHKLVDGKYLDTATHQIIDELPVIIKEESKKEAIPFGSETINSNTLTNGETKVTQEGTEGEKTINYQVTYRGNDEVTRKIINTQVTKEPIAKITTLGTYVAPVYTAPSYSAPSVTPSSGATAQCHDGSLSYSANRRGTCSHHGGVAIWY